MGPKTETPPPVPSTAVTGETITPDAPAPVLAQAFPQWPLGLPLSMHVYFTSSNQVDAFKRKDGHELPHFVWDNITFGNWDESRTIDLDIKLPEVSVMLSRNCKLSVFTSYVSQFNIMDLYSRTCSSQRMEHILTLRTLDSNGVLSTITDTVSLFSYHIRCILP